METKARVLDIHKDYRTGKFQLVLEVDSFNPSEDLRGEKRVIVKDWREKRSLDANAYMWLLLQEIAVKTGSTKEEVYEEFLRDYGFLDQDEKGYITITIRSDIDLSHLPGHWRSYATDSEEWRVLRKIKGTSEYDTKEMSYFLDRIIEAAQELGIDTMTPDEIERLKGYEKRVG